MPVKLGLVFVKKYQEQQQHQQQQINRNLIKKLEPQQPKGISLRRVMGAPKTGCKSCRG